LSIAISFCLLKDRDNEPISYLAFSSKNLPTEPGLNPDSVGN
jgi:hypothetical protein